jgi:hypothetical protein
MGAVLLLCPANAGRLASGSYRLERIPDGPWLALDLAALKIRHQRAENIARHIRRRRAQERQTAHLERLLAAPPPAPGNPILEHLRTDAMWRHGQLDHGTRRWNADTATWDEDDLTRPEEARWDPA